MKVKKKNWRKTKSTNYDKLCASKKYILHIVHIVKEESEHFQVCMLKQSPVLLKLPSDFVILSLTESSSYSNGTKSQAAHYKLSVLIKAN